MHLDGSAAADELHDLVVVARLDLRLGPFLAWKDLQIAFDGDAAAVQAEVAQQIGHRGARFGETCFSVYRYRRFHCFQPAAGLFGFARN